MKLPAGRLEGAPFLPVLWGWISGITPRGPNRLKYLNPKSMQNNSPKPIITGIRAMILHTLWVQVSIETSGPKIRLFVVDWDPYLDPPPTLN